jgi:RNA polymerase sigma factor (sigma-70 family)
MANRQLGGVLHQLRRLILTRETSSLSDTQLLEGFCLRRDEAAFTALVRRHGPMVLAVCRRLLTDPCDAEDAFQATFLVLVRKAGVIGRPEQLGNWLYGVAYRTALKARSSNRRRRTQERPLVDVPVEEPVAEVVWRELRPILDYELSRLPDKYRTPVVLCCLEGLTKRQAARQLGWPEGTLSTRLHHARQLLRRRLARRGLSLSAGATALALSPGLASAAVPVSLVSSTAKAATLFAASGAVPAAAAALMEGVLQAMCVSKLKVVTVVLVLAGFVGAGAGGFAYRSRAADGTGDEPAALAKAGDTQPAPPTVPGQAKDKEEFRRLVREEEARRLLGQLIKERPDDVELRKRYEKLLAEQKEEALRRKAAEADLMLYAERLAWQQEMLRRGFLAGDNQKQLEQLKRAQEDLARLIDELTRQQALTDIAAAVARLKEATANNPSQKPAVEEFEKAFQKLKDQLQKKPEPKPKGQVPPDELERAFQKYREQLQKKPEPKEEGPNPPPDNVRGEVLQVRRAEGLVTISLGSDAGVMKGHTLEVYRLEPKPMYLGRITILRADAQEAVGRIEKPNPDNPITIGDQVINQIAR